MHRTGTVESSAASIVHGRRVALYSLLVAIVAGCLVVLSYFGTARLATADIHAQGERQLRIIALDLEAVLERYETLPYAMAFQSDVAQALAHPADPQILQRLNATLQAIQLHAKVAAIYMMDRDGNTLASSNWDQPLSFVGRNFRYRPYFRDAIAGIAGRFYGIGSATGEPGYFIAQPIYRQAAQRGDAPIGVMAVKIDLSEFEHTWRSSEEPIALGDGAGVVFLSNRPDWKYHSLAPLDAPVQQELAATLQYAGVPIAPVAALARAQRAGFGAHLSQPVGRLGWQLMLFPSQAKIARTAALWAAATALLLATAALSCWALYQRRRRLEERQVSRQALQQAAQELERRIAQRTAELLQANQHLEAKYVRLQQTEQLLRSTQNELVQAGKLAMLGQMAAGVTHELNQPLAAIRAFADNAVTFLARGQAPAAEQNLAHISAAAARMGAIISQLKGFARKSHETVACVDLPRSIEASAVLLRNDFQRHGAELDIRLHSPTLQVAGDAVRIEQVLINLMRNALDAVEQASERRVSVVLEREAGQAVVRVTDSGAGIAQDIADHLFDPFFTTKPSGKGLGLGLAISSSIIQAMNGELTAHNREQGGAEFIVRLPLLDALEPRHA